MVYHWSVTQIWKVMFLLRSGDWLALAIKLQKNIPCKKFPSGTVCEAFWSISSQIQYKVNFIIWIFKHSLFYDLYLTAFISFYLQYESSFFIQKMSVLQFQGNLIRDTRRNFRTDNSWTDILHTRNLHSHFISVFPTRLFSQAQIAKGFLSDSGDIIINQIKEHFV